MEIIDACMRDFHLEKKGSIVECKIATCFSIIVREVISEANGSRHRDNGNID